jgi:tetratricopeptide (TPR) repeat protein
MKRQISVFIASPNDLVEERDQFKKTIDTLNVGFGDGADIKFVPFGWEDALASTGRRTQSVINAEIDRCDVFILAMYRRWGQEAPDAKPYSSYTEEEFFRALERWKKTEKPEIFVFFKRVDAGFEADPGPQLKKVLAFRKELEESKIVLYRLFDDKETFAAEVDRHLRAFAKGVLPGVDESREIVILPQEVLKEIKMARIIAEEKVKEAENIREESRLKIEAMQLKNAQDAAALSKEGKIEFARQKFSELVTETIDIRILSLGFEFFYRTGDIQSAQTVLNKWINLSGSKENSIKKSAAYGNLGILYKTRGELERAEEMHLRALTINEELGHRKGMASDYGNLGILYSIRGELERAEEMYLKSLTIYEELGHKEGMASDYGNLGIVYQIRGELERAEEMYLKALTIDEEFGRKEGMANQYCSLGILYQRRGEFEHAEEMYLKALAINEELGRKEGIASDYGNLGILYQIQGELERAEEMCLKALAIDEEMGRIEGIASSYANLGKLYQTRSELERAEEMYKRSLVIFEELGNKMIMAKTYRNLWGLYQTRGELERAEEMYLKALAIDEEMKRKA